MTKKLDKSFEAVTDRILRGQAALETLDGVPPWPRGKQPQDEFMLLMHRETPGCVALLGAIGQDVVLCGAWSQRLRDFLAAERSEEFMFPTCDNATAAQGLVALMCTIVDQQKGLTDDHFLWVAGAEAAELLAALSLHWKQPQSGSVH